MTTIQQPDDIDLLVNIMPPQLREAIERRNHRQEIIEIVLDLGRQPETRFPDRLEILSERPISREDIDYVVSRVGTFTEDNRAGIERTLHRISAIRNRLGSIIGITCRVGRAILGTVDILKDVIESGQSLLLLGRPGVGKTTLLREAARVLADELGKRVVIVDTSNEIGGDGDVPHPGIGRARRMQVPAPTRQHAVMIEAVENHMPEVIVIDEIGTEAEALAARTIAERGVQLIATAHGNALENLLQNPTLADLVGGVQVVTISDEEARRRGTRKSVLERKAPPTFTVLVELLDKDRVAIHHDLANVVDAFLDGLPAEPQERIRTADGTIKIEQEETIAKSAGRQEEARELRPERRKVRRRTTRIYTYAISKSRLERLIRKYRIAAELVEDISRADLVLTLKSQEKRQPRRMRELLERGVPLQVIRSNTATQIENFLRDYFKIEEQVQEEGAVLEEAETAVSEVFENGHPVELSPRPSHLRALQHQLVQRYGLLTESKGRDPFRRVIVFPL
jgi:stage III sporulation protein SpoIIIAA